LACYKTISKSNPSVLKAWERAGQAKIALKVDSEDEMLLLEAQAASLGLVARVIQDASVSTDASWTVSPGAEVAHRSQPALVPFLA
jgi:peptidyl-tRNA hydrolase